MDEGVISRPRTWWCLRGIRNTTLPYISAI
jgi:hypothetical protein